MYTYFTSSLLFLCILQISSVNGGVGRAPRRGCPMAAHTNHCSSGLAAKACTNDTDCAAGQFCCEIDCSGTACMEPMMKNGTCGLEIYANCLEEDEIDCRLDKDCQGDLLCCRTPCAGSQCRESGNYTAVFSGTPSTTGNLGEKSIFILTLTYTITTTYWTWR